VSPTERRAIHLKRRATSFILRPSISGSRNLAASSLPVWTTVSVSSFDWMTKRQVFY
jgi:hypothetical protein